MDLAVIGRHALLFDDDAAAAFINSSEALVEWNSLSIDRYDVRHLLSDLPPRKRRQSSPPHPDASLLSELDHERYLDLPSPSDGDEQDMASGVVPPDAGGFHAVSFSYGNSDESNDLKSNDADSGYNPPFPVPESLFQNLPPSEKVHQIIARTALFVKKHGGQSEIVLRVKQGDNPTFGFLMPDHHLHVYFRFLVEHPELLTCEANEKLIKEKEANSGALSLLGSVYGNGEDEDVAEESYNSQTNKSEDAVDVSKSLISQQSEQTQSSTNNAGKPVIQTKKSVFPLKENDLNNKLTSASSVKGRSAIKSSTASDLLSPSIDKSEPSALLGTSKVELPILEPPSDMKKVVDKIVEFILRNGRQFEAVLAEQDRSHGRFPFLLPSNHYHPYYLNILKKAQESKLSSKGFISERHESFGRGMDKKSASLREKVGSSLKSTDDDIPCDYERKDKFKMVIGKSKKEGVDVPSQPNLPPAEFTVDAAAAAAILQAATRGIKNSSLENFSKTSLIGSGHTSSIGGLPSSQFGSSVLKLDQKGESGVPVSVGKAIAETGKIAGVSEVDSSEHEKNLKKAERLKRAKIFATIIKGGSVPVKTDQGRGHSVEPLGLGTSTPVAQATGLVGKEREGSFDPFKSSKFEKNNSDSNNERRSKRSYRSRADRPGSDMEESEKEEEEKREHRHSMKKRRSHRSSHKHRKRHSSKHNRTSDCELQDKQRDSSDDNCGRSKSRRRNKQRDCFSSKHNRTSDCELQDKQRDSSDDNCGRSKSRRRNKSTNDEKQSKHESASEEERWSSRSKHKNYGSSSDESSHQRRASKRKTYHSADVEGEIKTKTKTKSNPSKASKIETGNRDPSESFAKFNHGIRAQSEPSNTIEAPEDLKAKIRAMLIATL